MGRLIPHIVTTPPLNPVVVVPAAAPQQPPLLAGLIVPPPPAPPAQAAPQPPPPPPPAPNVPPAQAAPQPPPQPPPPPPPAPNVPPAQAAPQPPPPPPPPAPNVPPAQAARDQAALDAQAALEAQAVLDAPAALDQAVQAAQDISPVLGATRQIADMYRIFPNEQKTASSGSSSRRGSSSSAVSLASIIQSPVVPADECEDECPRELEDNVNDSSSVNNANSIWSRFAAVRGGLGALFGGGAPAESKVAPAESKVPESKDDGRRRILIVNQTRPQQGNAADLLQWQSDVFGSYSNVDLQFTTAYFDDNPKAYIADVNGQRYDAIFYFLMIRTVRLEARVDIGALSYLKQHTPKLYVVAYHTNQQTMPFEELSHHGVEKVIQVRFPLFPNGQFDFAYDYDAIQQIAATMRDLGAAKR